MFRRSVSIMKLAFAAVLLPGLLSAQFVDLATTDDGGQLYFSSVYRQTGSSQFATPKIFRYTNGGFELYREVQYTRLLYPSIFSSAYELGGSSVSGNGQVAGFTGTARCFGGSACALQNVTHGEVDIFGASAPVITGYSVVVSGSGRYAVSYQPGYEIPAMLIDLLTGGTVTLPYPPAGGAQSVADDGTVLLLAGTQAVTLWKAGTQRSVTLSRQPRTAVISRNGASLVYQSADLTVNSTISLIALNMQTGIETVLSQHGDQDGSLPADPHLSNDGRRVLYLALAADRTEQLFLQQTDGTGLMQLTHEVGGINAGVLSGLANVAFAGTNSGRLVRIDLPGGEVEDLTGFTPTIGAFLTGTIAPGGLQTITGSSLTSPGAATPVLLNGVAVPVISASPTSLTFQVPFETAVQPPPK